MNQAGLHLLLTRSSCGLLQAPAPSGDVLEHILQAGLRAPDHGHLQPFQFLLAEGEGLQRLGRLLAASAKQDGATDELIERAEQMPLRAPMVITVVAKVHSHNKVPEFEQHLSAGCAVMAMQMAAQAQGFGGMWRSGPLMYSRALHEALGLAEQDQIVGFLYLGTPATALRQPTLVASADFVRWL
jgi:nitroreductase